MVHASADTTAQARGSGACEGVAGSASARWRSVYEDMTAPSSTVPPASADCRAQIPGGGRPDHDAPHAHLLALRTDCFLPHDRDRDRLCHQSGAGPAGRGMGPFPVHSLRAVAHRFFLSRYAHLASVCYSEARVQ